MKLISQLIALLVITLVAVSAGACRRNGAAPEPEIEAAPLGPKAGQWKVVSADTVKLTVTAPEAVEVKLLYKPAAAVRRHAALKTITAPPGGDGKFSMELKPGPDFIGDVWAEILYPTGVKKKTASLSLASEAAVTQGGEIQLDSVGASLKTDESERSDKLTGGRIAQTSLAPGDHRIWITVNVPAFRLTLWQNGKEVRTYQIGVGRRGFPLPVGERKATGIIWNPEWIPPDSPWVEESDEVEAGERIEADDPRNPLGKVKILLGGAILIHEAAKPSDIGRLVSHGCVRMLTEDLFDLAEKIVAARALPVTKDQIEQAKTSTRRLSVKLDPPVWVDINYDTQVIEVGVLRLYPDIYKRGVSTLENLRAELSGAGVDAAKLDKQTLQQMLERVSVKEGFRVSIADIKAGRAVAVGLQFPMAGNQVE
ncbi:MAG TPA: L,D-transpeptidase [Blastocatellia bacterium]|nr:L,D-transpeptidase [Blastocatellia bacterium]